MSGIEGLIYDRTSQQLADAIAEAAQRQAIYSYNIANASTPGFKPLKFKKALDDATAKLEQEDEFNLEDEMAKMSDNRLRHSAYTKLLSAKIQITKKVVTLGKGG